MPASGSPRVKPIVAPSDSDMAARSRGLSGRESPLNRQTICSVRNIKTYRAVMRLGAADADARDTDHRSMAHIGKARSNQRRKTCYL